jgi:hypothetical protein
MPDLNSPNDLFVINSEVRHVTMLNAGVMRAEAVEPVLDGDEFLITFDIAGLLNVEADAEGDRPTYSDRYVLTDEAAVEVIRRLTVARADRLDLVAQRDAGEPTA